MIEVFALICLFGDTAHIQAEIRRFAINAKHGREHSCTLEAPLQESISKSTLHLASFAFEISMSNTV
jgi:hypothetical protein